jgi:hypothetical protein
MFIDIILRPKDASRGTYDVQGYGISRKPINVKLYARDASRGTYDVQLRPTNRVLPSEIVVPPGFPTQYSGFKIRKTGSTIELCMVAEADAATGMGGVPKIRKGGVTYAIYLVETADGNASPVRIKTTTGTKAIRVKT